MPGGMTSVVRSATGGAGGGFTNNSTDRSASIVASTGSIVTVNYLDTRGATNIPARYYRIRVQQPGRRLHFGMRETRIGSSVGRSNPSRLLDYQKGRFGLIINCFLRPADSFTGNGTRPVV